MAPESFHVDRPHEEKEMTAKILNLKSLSFHRNGGGGRVTVLNSDISH